MSSFQNGFEQAKELFEWYKRVFTVAGVWPLQSTYRTFAIWIIYTGLQYIMDIAKLLHVVEPFDVIISAGDVTWISMTIPNLIVLRCSRTLATLMTKIRDDINGKHLESDEEKELYFAYNRMAKSFAKVLVSLTTFGALMHYFGPFVLLIRAVLLFNESVPVILPYQTYLIFDINDYFTLTLWWIYQIPMLYINVMHSVTLSFAVFLIYHACGQLSALANRIKNLGVELAANTHASETVFRRIVETHKSISGVTNDINDVFNIIFLEELFITSIMIILTTYTVIAQSDFSDKTVLFTHASYTIIMFTLIYGYCVAGEYLITESTNVHEAYYQCQWYDLPDTYKKQLIICMIGSSKPIHLLGGSFYIFKLESFTNVLKTALSYISVLRTMIND